ncbi:MAG: hypothetical protein Edafosvirus15_3 [Edafosvirus sp.]|uniref:Uncharacterized protein n=1 Tax=Edafosvirus sp. TaxID=2487765 RepID=A0A3G4ZUA1_9VIRU|nr:MAG: hypothetical protein Edafosvirus15_3 [Edafosvirus sp.]
MVTYNVTNDIWNIGFANKNGLWAYYSITNYFGALLCSILWASIVFSKNKKNGDIFIAGLAFGCLTMSIPCATECVLCWYWGQNRFQYGKIACQLEAYFHVSAILFQFFSVGLIAWSYHSKIIRSKNNTAEFEEKSLMKAYLVLFASWITSYLGIFILGLYSNILLLDAGVYCFYEFTSPVMLWFDVMLAGVTCSIIYWYRKIYIFTKNSVTTSSSDTKIIKKLANTVTMYIAILVVGWFSALIVSIYALSTGSSSRIGDTFVGVFGSLHSVLVGLAYGYNSDKLKKFLVRYCCCQKCFPNYRLTIKHDDMDGRQTVIEVKSNTPIKDHLSIPIRTSIVSPPSAVNLRSSTLVIDPHSQYSGQSPGSPNPACDSPVLHPLGTMTIPGTCEKGLNSPRIFNKWVSGANSSSAYKKTSGRVHPGAGWNGTSCDTPSPV